MSTSDLAALLIVQNDGTWVHIYDSPAEALAAAVDYTSRSSSGPEDLGTGIATLGENGAVVWRDGAPYPVTLAQRYAWTAGMLGLDPVAP